MGFFLLLNKVESTVTAKGKRVNIRAPGDFFLAFHRVRDQVWITYGDVNELGDVGAGSGKSSLFFLTAFNPSWGNHPPFSRDTNARPR